MIRLGYDEENRITTNTKISKYGKSYFFLIPRALKDLLDIPESKEFPITYIQEENELRIKLPGGGR